jgi:predicted nucleotide-binding protein
MWEHKQGKAVELLALKMHETEKHQYTSRRVYLSDNGLPDSLTGWCYINGEDVWIVDEEGISRDKEYDNLVDNSSTMASRIPQGTVFEYNREKIRTEICVPLRINIHGTTSRTAGVLNIEARRLLMPSNQARSFAQRAANTIEQLQNWRIALKAAEEWHKSEMHDLRDLMLSYKKREKESPNLYLSAFVVRSFGHVAADKIYTYVKQELEAQKIIINEVATANEISMAIWREIDSSHFGVVISTSYNRNVLLEWGYLLGSSKPVIVLHQPTGDREQPPFDVSGTMFFEYAGAGADPAEDTVRGKLRDGIKAMLKSHDELRALRYPPQ